MSASTLTFNITTKHPDFNIILLLEELLWKDANEYGIIGMFSTMDEVCSRACRSLMCHIDDMSVTGTKIANAILTGEWELA